MAENVDVHLYTFFSQVAVQLWQQRRIQGAGVPWPPVVSVCNIFCAWLLAFRHRLPRSLHPSALSTDFNRIAEGVGITPPLPNPNLGSATLELQV